MILLLKVEHEMRRYIPIDLATWTHDDRILLRCSKHVLTTFCFTTGIVPKTQQCVPTEDGNCILLDTVQPRRCIFGISDVFFIQEVGHLNTDLHKQINHMSCSLFYE